MEFGISIDTVVCFLKLWNTHNLCTRALREKQAPQNRVESREQLQQSSFTLLSQSIAGYIN